MKDSYSYVWQTRPYGRRTYDVIGHERRGVRVVIREPAPYIEPSGVTVIMANGWTAGRNSMRVPAITATEYGHRAVTLEYTNTSGGQGALQHNVQDVLAVIKAQPKEARISLMGLSMGGAVVTMALDVLRQERAAQASKPLRRRQSVPQVETANLVAPGKYILPEYINEYEVAKQFFAEMQEVTEIGRNPLLAARIGFTSMRNCVRRPRAVATELHELLNGTVHEELRRVMDDQDDPPFVRLVLPVNDKLLPFFAQEVSVAGLPFSEVLPISGGHGGLAYTPSLSRAIFAEDTKRTLTVSRQESVLPLSA